jgi:hypothetical protein
MLSCFEDSADDGCKSDAFSASDFFDSGRDGYAELGRELLGIDGTYAEAPRPGREKFATSDLRDLAGVTGSFCSDIILKVCHVISCEGGVIVPSNRPG